MSVASTSEAKFGPPFPPLADGDAYDLIFDNDGAAEIADVVSLRVTDGLVQVTLASLANTQALRRPAPASGILVRFADRRLEDGYPEWRAAGFPSNSVIRALSTAIAG